ncbi:MAG TPA: NAD(P)H-hydrate dehydratase [Nocardioidaceae bacterium]|nr:NAD(P)H-hydrate dehydratase [Nocardioidaceae bacterium]
MPGSDVAVVTPALLRGWALPEPGGDKEARGELLVVGGSRRTPGAVRLAGEAALRAGGGKLRLATVASMSAQLAVAVPEAMVLGLPEDAAGQLAVEGAEEVVSAAATAAVVLLGPGFADPQASVRLLAEIVPRLESTVVVDALASAYVTEKPEGLRHLDGRVVLTLNPNELAHIAGQDQGDVREDPLRAAVAIAERCRAVVVCGGRQKLVVAPDGARWVVQGGGPGLGISGSGDVQSGIVSGLLARGAEPAQAAVWGAYLHARTGERLAASVGTVGYLARELPGEVPPVLAELR